MDSFVRNKEMIRIFAKMLRGLDISEEKRIHDLPAWEQLYYLQAAMELRDIEEEETEREEKRLPMHEVATSDEKQAIQFLDYYRIPWKYKTVHGRKYLAAATVDVTRIWDEYNKMDRRYCDIRDHAQFFLSVNPAGGEKTAVYVMNPYMSLEEAQDTLKKFKELELCPYSVYGNDTPSLVRKISLDAD
ncbi:hypothetical protein MOZ60_10880 [Stecheria sp. CLA-KB-P133]|uniref:Uncharacterized protein n=1 Tax=Grylomicrobium aquisgranensis TaxID=2926318 RepID=A0AB35U6S0_9FIRM|nr:hypothetical protein [Stecheria sp. CLA-KB-P133]